jgi:hypothetical protein
MVFIAFFSLVLLSTFHMPLYLATIQNYRAMDMVALWCGMLCRGSLAPVAATILRVVVRRLTMAMGYALVGCGCFLAGQLTHDWTGGAFLSSQIVQAVCQSHTDVGALV